jgi:bacterioferritin-associated ferredoxin
VRICHCRGVSENQIRSAIDAGARSPVEIAAQCRAGTGCGGCLPEVCRLLDDHLTGLAYYAGCGDCPLLLEEQEAELLSA